MKRAARWLVLLGLIVTVMTLFGGAARAQTGVTASIICNQYLRAEPSEDAPRVGLMNPGETHNVLGRHGAWLFLEISAVLQGWAYDGSCLNVNGDVLSVPVLNPAQLELAAYSGPPTASVLCTQYLRRAPGANAEVLKILDGSDSPLSIGGRTADNNWMLVTTASGQVGWTATCTDCMSVLGNFYGVPVVSVSGIGYGGLPVVDVLCAQYVRARPDLEASRVAIMQVTDAPWTINGRDFLGNWLWVTNADGGFTGWTAVGECISIQGDYGAIPVVTDITTTYVGPPVATLVCTQNLRAYPSNEGRRLAVLDASAGLLQVIGRSADVGWVYVQTSAGQQGWMASGNCLSVQGSLFDVPVMAVEGYSGPPIVQISCSQYLRAAPSTNASRIAVLQPRHGPLAVIGRDEGGGWVYVQLPDGTAGWTANAECVGVLGDVLAAPLLLSGATAGIATLGPPTARIQCSQYLRAEPAVEATRLAILQPGDGIYNVEGRTEDANWLYLSQEAGFQGWAAWGDCLSVQGDVYGLPVLDTRAYAGAPVASFVCAQYLRAGPAADYNRFAVIPAGTAASIIGRSEDSTWLLLNTEDGFLGWAAWGDCLRVQGNAYTAPIIGPTVYGGAPFATVECSQYLRALPDDSSPPVMILNGTEGALSITGRTANQSWMQIRLEDGTVGWAATGVCLNVIGDFYSLPVVTADQPEYAGPPVATVSCSQYLRALPSQDAPTIAVINGLEGVLRITGHTSDNRWMQITLEDGRIGWAVTGACLGVRGRLSDAPVLSAGSPTYSGMPVATLTCTQYMRAMPDTDSAELDILEPRDGALPLLGRNQSGTWLYIQNAEGDEGWTANAACLVVQGNVMSLPVQPVTFEAGPPTADILCNANLRRNPIPDGERMAVLSANTGLLAVIGRDDETDWILVEHPSGLVGWLNLGDCVSTQGNILSVPVPAGPRDPELWTVLRAEGSCDGTDQASQIIAAYNRSGPIGPVSRQCTTDADGIRALTQFRVEIAIVDDTCPGFQTVPLSGGQTLCHRFLRTTQLDDFMGYARAQ